MRIYKKNVSEIVRKYFDLLLDSGMLEIDISKRLEAEIEIVSILLDRISLIGDDTFVKKSNFFEDYKYQRIDEENQNVVKIRTSMEDTLEKQIAKVLNLSRNIEEIYALDDDLQSAFKTILMQYEQDIRVNEEI
ncbi:MAG: hypothetical protein HYS16_01555 [Deltaproteobacteria bacterium]|nr:MAG: hypothetical protein HYS16_01555 [Deltaproteobacteria bacterium]